MGGYGPGFWALFFTVGLALLLLLRIPVAVALLAVSSLGAILLYGLEPGLEMTVVSMVSGLSTFTLTAIPLFLLMGEVLFRSGVAYSAITAIDRVFRRVPGRLAFLTIGTGTVLGVVSGSVMASTALLGATLVPEMEKRGYSRSLSVGSVLGAGGLAVILPPSTLVIIWGSTAGVPVGPLLIAGVLPGLLMATGYLVIVALRTFVFGGAELPARVGGRTRGAPARTGSAGERALVDAEHASELSAALADEVPLTRRERIVPLLSLASILMLVVGVITLILFGVMTPTESAAAGAAMATVIAALHGRLTWTAFSTALRHAISAMGMIFFIIASAAIYGRVMAGSGTVTGFVDLISSITANPYLLVVIMLAIVVFLGLFLESIALCLITIPLFMPIVAAAGIDPIWFGMMMIICVQVGTITPPFGLSLFVMRQYAPAGMQMSQIYRAAFPYVVSDLTVVALIVAFPVIVTFLPSLM